MKKKPTYLVLIGFNYGKDNKRHEANETVNNLPFAVAENLLAQRAIAPLAEASQPSASQPSEGVSQ